MSEAVYFFDDKQQLIETIFEENLIQSVQEKEISEEKSDLLKDVLTVQTIYLESIENAAYMAVEENDKSFTVYRIVKLSNQDDVLLFIGINFGADELDGTIVKDIRPTGESIKSVATRLIAGTEWRIGHVDNTLGAVSGSFYYVSIKEALKHLQTFGCEIVFKCNVKGNGISDKWIEIYKQIGTASNERFTYGDKAFSVVREQDRSGVFTSLIGRGRGEEVGDGYGRRIEFVGIEWKKSKGDPIDKPKGQNWIEMPEMTALLGIPTKNGGMRKREQVVIFEDIEDQKELLKATYEQLLYTSRQLVQFKTNVYGGDAIGNTVTVHRYDRAYHYRTRIFKIQLDRLTRTCQADLGDKISKGTDHKMATTEKGLEILDKSKMTFYESTEVSKFQSDIIRGAKGGSIIMMNPEDTGKGTSREPYQMVWMNGPNIQNSNHFLVANSEGIGFIDGDFNMSNFKTAWTINGTFNADYIRAGVIRAGIFENSFNGTGDTLKLVKGMMQIWNARVKIMELTKKGLEFWRGTDNIGTIGTTGELPSWVAGYNGDKDRAIQIKLAGGDFVKIFNESDDGLYIPSRKHINSDSSTRVTLYGKDGVDVTNGSTGGVSITKRGVEIMGKLYVGGKEVTPGGGTGGSGGWNGEYPPQISTQAEKFAWQAWVTLISLGYSMAAAAGILGNIQGEAGPSMNPDTEQVGGPAYGAIQFDGSSYPLIGSPTNNGREYFQRLHTASGAGGNYREMAPQMKVVNWTMTNGQWIGAVDPTTVSGFKGINSPEQAAYAFEKNFERPANAHPEREGYARAWYNKFKDLAQPSGKYGYPVLAGTPVTSWFGPRWGTMHNGIDFAGSVGDPIFASQSGTVAYSYYDNDMGEWVVIKHDNDAYMTGYAHNSARLVDVGDKVSKGQQIARMGSTGDSTGPHCHFAVQTSQWSGYVDPAPFLGLTPP